MSKPKPPSESQNSIFLWLRPWFNSNVDAIITDLFCEHAFCQASSRTQTIQLLLTLSLFSSIQLKLRPRLLHFLSSLGSVRVMARISLAIRDIIKKFEGIASAAEEIFVAFLGNIQKHHLPKG